MRNRLFKKILFGLAVAFIAILLSTNAYASKDSKAKSAYSKILSKKKIKWGKKKISTKELKFDVVDFDNDGISELCVAAYVEKSYKMNGYYEAWSYKNGKVVRKDIGDSHMSDVVGYYPSKHVILSKGGYHDAQDIRLYEKYKNGKTKLQLFIFRNELSGKWYYRDSKGNNISKKKYKKQLTKLIGKAKYKKIKFKKNTAKNRANYL